MDKQNQKTYRAHQVCELLNISKKTLFTWEKDGYFPKICRDWRSWRIYTEADIQNIQSIKENKSK